MKFLNENEYDQFMSKKNEERHIEHTLYCNVTHLYNELSRMNKSLYSEYGELRLQKEIQEMYVQQAEEFLNNRVQVLKEKPFPTGFDNSDHEQLFEKYEKIVEEMIDEQFENHLFLKEWIEEIKFIMIQSLVKDFSDRYSGIVFAGFGDKEIYPSVYLIIIDGKINNKTKYFIRKRTINHTTYAVILPLAQRDMIRSFLDGIHEDVEGLLSTVLKSEFNALSDTLIAKLKDHLREDVDLELVEEEMSNEFTQVFERYQKSLKSYKRDNFINPILDVLESMPTKELAHMAESLLNLTSLKRKISISMETVGGPIDVAVITKGDGFSWIKKK